MNRVAHERLRNQRIERSELRRGVDVVRWLVASQAQDYAAAKWALGLRTTGLTDPDVERELDSGAIVRTHVMRPTWHFVSREDVRWLVALTAPRVNAVNAHRYRQLELDAATLRKANAVFARELEGGRHLIRDELREALARARIGTEDQRMAHILMHAELDALVCSGPRRGKRFTYALLEERAPQARVLSREDALAELAGRYFAGRGPATVRDFAKWSGLAAADARRGLEAVAGTLERAVLGGVVHWSGAPARSVRHRPPRAHLLSIYDEYLSSYRDRGALCDPAFAKRLAGMGAALGYVVVLDGRIAGTFRRTVARQSVRIEVTLFRRIDAAEREAVAAAGSRFARFLGEGYSADLTL